MKTYTVDELGLKDLRYKDDEIARYIDNENYKALDGSIIDLQNRELLETLGDYIKGGDIFRIQTIHSYTHYSSYVLTFRCNNSAPVVINLLG